MTWLRKPVVLSVFLGIAFVLMQLWDVSTYPLVSPDEAMLNDPGLQLARTGEFHSDVFRVLPHYNGFYFWQPPGLSLTVSVFYRVLGFGIWQTRIPDIIFGGGVVALGFLWLCDLTGGIAAGLLAALGLFCLPDLVLTSKMARMDTAAIAFMLAATIILFREIGRGSAGNPRNLPWGGLCAGAAGMFHTAAFPWFLGLLVILLVYSPRRAIWPLYFLAGAALPVLSWLGMACVHPHEFRAQFLFQVANRTVQGGLLARFAGEGLRYLSEFKRVPFFAAAIGAVAILVARAGLGKDRVLQRLILLTACAALFNAILAGKESGYYTLYPKTLIICTLSVYLAAGSGTDRGRRIALVLYALGVLNCAALAYGPRLAAKFKQPDQRDYAHAFAPLYGIIKPGDQVWGSTVAWYAVVKAGGRLDAQPEAVPAKWPANAHPDPALHRFVVTEPDRVTNGLPGFKKIAEIRPELPLVFGSRLADRSYSFDVFQSEIIK